MDNHSILCIKEIFLVHVQGLFGIHIKMTYSHVEPSICFKKSRFYIEQPLIVLLNKQ